MIVEEAASHAGQFGDRAAAAVDDGEVRDVARAKVPDDDRDRTVAAGLEPWPGEPHPVSLRVVRAEQDRYVVASLVGDQHVRNIVAIDVGHRHARRGRADKVRLRRWGESGHAIAIDRVR